MQQSHGRAEPGSGLSYSTHLTSGRCMFRCRANRSLSFPRRVFLTVASRENGLVHVTVSPRRQYRDCRSPRRKKTNSFRPSIPYTTVQSRTLHVSQDTCDFKARISQREIHFSLLYLVLTRSFSFIIASSNSSTFLSCSATGSVHPSSTAPFPPSPGISLTASNVSWNLTTYGLLGMLSMHISG